MILYHLGTYLPQNPGNIQHYLGCFKTQKERDQAKEKRKKEIGPEHYLEWESEA